MVIYSMDANAVEPVFYPVVPDSFMSRHPGNVAERSTTSRFGEWQDEVDRPLLSPCDRWSF